MTIDADRAALARGVYRAAHLTGTFRLRSGLVSDEYFDKQQRLGASALASTT